MSFIGGHWIYIIILFMIVLIIWGPGKLPDVGAGMGRAIREFRKASSETHDTFTQAVTGNPTTPAPQAQQPLSPVPSPTVTQAPVTPTESPAQPSETPPQTPVTR
jgi:sec-independent protein translocase protein TatA